MLDHLIWPETGSWAMSVCATADFWTVLGTFNKCLLYPLHMLVLPGLAAVLSCTEVNQSCETRVHIHSCNKLPCSAHRITVIYPSVLGQCLLGSASSLRLQQNQGLESEALNLSTLTSWFWCIYPIFGKSLSLCKNLGSLRTVLL